MGGHFPISRIHTIMKSSADVDVVSKESTFVIARAAEMFVKVLAKEAFKDAKKGKKLDYKNIANIVNSNSRYDFLREMIPHKISVDEYYNIIKRQNRDEGIIDVSDETSSSSESSSEEEENVNTKEDKSNKSSSDSDVIVLD